MISVKCTYESGDIVYTRINGTIAEAKKYFEGKFFNIGSIEDNVQKCVNVEEIK